MTTIDSSDLDAITGGLSTIPDSTGPTFPRPSPWPIPRPSPLPDPSPSPFPGPGPIDPRILLRK